MVKLAEGLKAITPTELKVLDLARRDPLYTWEALPWGRRERRPESATTRETGERARAHYLNILLYHVMQYIR